MHGPFKAIQVTEDVYWVGAIDWSIRDFHGYETSRGTTYNAYLVMGDKVTLVDTVKAPFRDEMLSRIASVVDPERIDVIISNHAEMDHSGCLPDVIRRLRPAQVFASSKGVEALRAHFHEDLPLTAVKEGEMIELSGPGAPGGPLTVRFFETRLLHWPDSMFSYVPERKLLFSQDGFGMHLAGYPRWDDEYPLWLLEHETAKYFANILMPFTPQILKLFDKLDQLKLDISLVAPDHGPIWRRHFAEVAGWYRRWAQHQTTRKAIVVYDTMWESTDAMARAVGEGLAGTGTAVKLLSLKAEHRSDVATELLDAGALVVGSPTLNGQLFPTLADVLTYLRGLKPKNRLAASFGSYGWSGESVKQIDQYLADMGMENLGSVKTSYVPDGAILQACHALGARVGEQLQARHP